MPSYLSTLLALGALGNVATAANIYTYTRPGCSGCGFFAANVGQNTCILTITGSANSTAAAIVQGQTTVQSGKLQTANPSQKHFLTWGPGPGKDDNKLPLQCGTIQTDAPVRQQETCISQPATGYSWYDPTISGKKRDATKCTSTKEADGIVSPDGTHYSLKGASAEDAATMKKLANDGSPNVPVRLNKYKVSPPSL